MEQDGWILPYLLDAAQFIVDVVWGTVDLVLGMLVSLFESLDTLMPDIDPAAALQAIPPGVWSAWGLLGLNYALSIVAGALLIRFVKSLVPFIGR